MATYKIIGFNERNMEHRIQDINTGNTFTVDLFVDATFEPNPFPENTDFIDAIKIQAGMIGKTIEIERIEPCTYFACNVKIIEK